MAKLATFIEGQVGALGTASYGGRGEKFRRRGKTSFTIVVIPPVAIRRRIVNAACVVATVRSVTHVANHTATHVPRTLTAELGITLYIVQQRVFDTIRSPALELDTQYLRWYAELTGLIRQSSALAAWVGTAETEVRILEGFRLKMRIQGVLNCHVQFCVVY